MSEEVKEYNACGWRGYVHADWSDEFSDLDSWLSQHSGTVVVEQPTRRVSRVECVGGAVYVKHIETLVDGRHFFKDIWKRLKWRFCANRSLRTWAVTRSMRACGIGCAEPLLCARRTRGMGAEEVFIAREVPYVSVPSALSEHANSSALVERILSEVSVGLAAFHRPGFVHGDCIPGNLLYDIAQGRVYFIDNDRTFRYQVGSLVWRTGVKRNLIQFCNHLSYEVADPKIVLRFIDMYSCEHEEFHVDKKHLVRCVCRRMHSQRHKRGADVRERSLKVFEAFLGGEGC